MQNARQALEIKTDTYTKSHFTLLREIRKTDVEIDRRLQCDSLVQEIAIAYLGRDLEIIEILEFVQQTEACAEEQAVLLQVVASLRTCVD